LRDGVSENEFSPKLHGFFQHFIDTGFARRYRVMRREALDGFGKTLSASHIEVNSSIPIESGSTPSLPRKEWGICRVPGKYYPQ
jgi:hypothetical protein